MKSELIKITKKSHIFGHIKDMNNTSEMITATDG